MKRSAQRADSNRDQVRVARLPPDLHATFSAAVQHHNAGRLREADGLYRQVLDAFPTHADSLHLLGVLAHEIGRFDVAVDLIGRAIALAPKAALYHGNLGNALKRLGRLEEAVASFRRAIALKPNYPEVLTNLGNALLSCHQLEEAASCLQKAIRLKPDLPEAHNNLGNVYAALGRPNDAIHCYRKAIALRPNDAAAYNNMGAALKDLGHLEETISCYQQGIAHNPDLPELHNNLAIILLKQGLLDQSAASSRTALRLRSHFPEGHDNLGRVLAEQGKLSEAIVSFREAVALRPDYADAHNNLGTVLKETGALDEAVGCFRTAIRHNAKLALAHHNLAMALLLHGDLAEGWREYEWRWRVPQPTDLPRNFIQPQWQGEAGAGRTLLIHAEQGFGDTIQFCRYARLAHTRGLRVVLEVQQPLVRLLQSLAGVDQVIARGDKLPDFDVHCPMLSLPLAFGTTLESIPGDTPYLSASAAQVAGWHTRLSTPLPRIGLAWAGGAATKSDRQRSLSAEQLAPLLNLPGIQWVSLQKDRKDVLADAGMLDFMPKMHDFADTAALVANLDLVISVDTAIAHLAAALGKPVWLLNRFDPDWRWLTGRQDSPWYATLRQYRQPQPGEWEAPIAAIAEDLSAFKTTSAY
jgi:tetratricopeptide (TPR) repeat protein